jgi:hypothetical protein
MSSRIVGSVLAAVVLFALYSWYTTRTAPEYFDVNSQQYEYPGAPSPPVEPSSPERTVAPSGPNPPSQLSKKAAVVVQEELPYDPQEQPHESAELPERLRNPERMFSPGLANDNTDVVAGVTSYASQMTENAHQVFGPEFAQNGGNFMSGVMANDTSLKTDYSSV